MVTAIFVGEETAGGVVVFEDVTRPGEGPREDEMF
jgi:hypothetical protein